jgi:hypothetical protein
MLRRTGRMGLTHIQGAQSRGIGFSGRGGYSAGPPNATNQQRDVIVLAIITVLAIVFGFSGCLSNIA